jgi:hypothetical protein
MIVYICNPSDSAEGGRMIMSSRPAWAKVVGKSLFHKNSWTPMAHAHNPSYLGGLRFEASPANSSVRPYLRKPFTKIGLVDWLKVKALSSAPVPPKKIPMYK